jgi:hypothetical protein
MTKPNDPDVVDLLKQAIDDGPDVTMDAEAILATARMRHAARMKHATDVAYAALTAELKKAFSNDPQSDHELRAELEELISRETKADRKLRRLPALPALVRDRVRKAADTITDSLNPQVANDPNGEDLHFKIGQVEKHLLDAYELHFDTQVTLMESGNYGRGSKIVLVTRRIDAIYRAFYRYLRLQYGLDAPHVESHLDRIRDAYHSDVHTDPSVVRIEAVKKYNDWCEQSKRELDGHRLTETLARTLEPSEDNFFDQSQQLCRSVEM